MYRVQIGLSITGEGLYLLVKNVHDKLVAMKIWFSVAVFTCCTGSVACSAQTTVTAQSVEAQLKAPILIMRGMYDGRALKFDSEGNLIGKAKQLPFSLSAVRLDGVRVRASEVVIEAQREGLEFLYSRSSNQRWVREQAWGDEVRIEVALDARHPEELSSALAKVFCMDIDANLADEVPAYWRPWVQHQLDPSVNMEANSTNAIDLGYDWEKPKSKDITPPRMNPTILRMPEDPLIAQHVGYIGAPTLAFVIDASGKPAEIRIVRPVGMDLDEAAVKVASQLRFKPALYKGKPAAVLIDFVMPFSPSLDWGSQFERGPTTPP